MDKQLDVQDATIVQMLTTLPTKWRNVAHRTLSDAQEKALARLIEGGLVDARIEAVGWMDNFPQVVRLRALVIGRYKLALRVEVLSCCKAWVSSDGLTRDSYRFWYEVMEVRLTEEGELAKGCLAVEGDLPPVQFINFGGWVAGRVRCEWFGIEVQGSPDAARQFAMTEVARLERIADGPDDVVQDPPAAGDGSIEATGADRTVDSEGALTAAQIFSRGRAPIGQRLCDADAADPDMQDLAETIFGPSVSTQSAIERVANQPIPCLEEITGAARRSDDTTAQRGSESPQGDQAKPKWTWQQVKCAAESHVKRNVYPGLNALAKIIGCSSATLSKAITHSSFLKARKAEHKQQTAGEKRPVSLPASDGVIEDKTAADPTHLAEIKDDFEKLLKTMKPDELLEFEQLSADKQAELAKTYRAQVQDTARSDRAR